MNKQSLIHLLKEGLNTCRISQDDYNHALDFYALIYEEKSASESSDAHAELCRIINSATASTGVMNPQLTTDQTAVIEAELLAAEEYLSEHPILSVSLSDLEREKKSIDEYLSQPRWTSEVELWKEFYDV